MSTSIHHLITDDLLAVKGHLHDPAQPCAWQPIAASELHAISAHYHVSQVNLSLWVLVLMPVISKTSCSGAS